MAEEIVYADLDIGSGRCCRKVPSLPQPRTSSCPRWHRVALCAGWTGNLLLGVAVVAMGCSWCRGHILLAAQSSSGDGSGERGAELRGGGPRSLKVLHQQPQNPESCKNGSGNVGDGNSTMEKIRSELRKDLCPSNLQEAGGCKVCPWGWTLHGTKCFWAADEFSSWNESRRDCASRGAELLMPWDQDELDFLNKIIGKPRSYFWIGLSRPSAGMDWTWLNGSRLDQSRFRFRVYDRYGGKCGALNGKSISSAPCSSSYHWICQKEATQL